MFDVIGVIFLLLVGAFGAIAIGALAIWIADTTYTRRMKRDRQPKQKTTDR